MTGKNLGFARANNLGLKKVKTAYSLVLNPDVIMSSNQLIKLERVSQTIDFGILTCNCNELLSTLGSYSNKVEKFSINKSKSFSSFSFINHYSIIESLFFLFENLYFSSIFLIAVLYFFFLLFLYSYFLHP